MTPQASSWLGNLRDVSVWCEPLVSYLFLSSLLLVLAYACALSERDGSGKRRAWRAAFVGLVVLLVAEVTGLTNLTVLLLQSALVSEASASAPSPAAAPSGGAFSYLTVLRGELPWLLAWLGVVWAVGTALLAVRLAWFRLTLARRSAELLPVKSPGLVSRMNRLTSQHHLRCNVRLAVLPGLCTPLVFGARHPTVVLPERFEQQYASDAQDAILAHELGHVAGADYAWQLFAEVVTAVLWWHPLVWWGRRQLLAANEVAADEATLRVQDGPALLAEALVTAGRQLLSRRPVRGAFAIIGTRGGLSHRVRHLLRLADGTSGTGTPAWKRLLPGVAIAIVALVAASGVLRAKTSDVAANADWRQAFRSSPLGNLLVAKPAKERAKGYPESFVCPTTGEVYFLQPAPDTAWDARSAPATPVGAPTPQGAVSFAYHVRENMKPPKNP